MERPSMNRRGLDRKAFPQGVLIERKGISRWFGGVSSCASRYTVQNISEGGVCFENHRMKDRAFVAGDKIIFQMQGYRVDSFRGSGRIAWTRITRHNAAQIQVIGVRFAKIPGRVRSRIAGLN